MHIILYPTAMALALLDDRNGLKRRPHRNTKRRKLVRVRVQLCILPPLCIYFFVVRKLFDDAELLLTGHHNNIYLPTEETRRIAHHDKTSTFSIMRTRKRSVGDRPTSTGNLTVDALSIGTQHNLGLVEAQSRSWASHRSVRHFFAATEADDSDPTCAQTINITDLEGIRDLCQKHQPMVKEGALKSHVKGFSKNFLDRGPGWMCAQQRFATALQRLGRFYRNELEVDDAALPDFLFLQDDDTYFNMLKMNDFLREMDPSRPMAEAPCLVQHVKHWYFSFPWGGFGFILSKGAVANLIRPIYCDKEAQDEFENKVCSRLKENILGEARFFVEGMSVSDLMGAHVDNNLFRDYATEDWSYCLHGDWAVGYYINYYYVSSHIEDPRYQNVTEFRIESHLGGVFTGHWGECKHRKLDKCDETAYVCHKQTATSMVNLTERIAAKAPEAFDNFQ